MSCVPSDDQDTSHAVDISDEPDLSLLKPDPDDPFVRGDQEDNDGFDHLLTIKQEIKEENVLEEDSEPESSSLDHDGGVTSNHCDRIIDIPAGDKLNDTFAPYNSEERAKKTLPEELLLQTSSVSHEEGVYAKIVLSPGTSFGPYEGVVTKTKLSRLGVAVFIANKLEYYIDGSDVTKANWMRYVQWTNDATRDNMECYQCDGQIYYRTSKYITPGEELFLHINKHLACTHESTESATNIIGRSDAFLACSKKPDDNSTSSAASAPQPKSDKTVKKHTCPVCDKVFDSRSRLSRHSMVHSGSRPHVCKFCGRGFTQAIHMQTHERIHTGERPYKCSFCDDAFIDSSHLTRHVRKHTGEAPFKCRSCGKRFKESGTLISHARIHTDHRPHICSICDKGFIEASKLQRHMMMHTNDRPHTCDVCNKSFSQNVHLSEHMLIHTGETPHHCPHCDQAFQYRRRLKTHIAKKHTKK